MSDLTLRQPAPVIPTSFVEVLKQAFSATPLGIALAALKG